MKKSRKYTNFDVETANFLWPLLDEMFGEELSGIGVGANVHLIKIFGKYHKMMVAEANWPTTNKIVARARYYEEGHHDYAGRYCLFSLAITKNESEKGGFWIHFEHEAGEEGSSKGGSSYIKIYLMPKAVYNEIKVNGPGKGRKRIIEREYHKIVIPVLIGIAITLGVFILGVITCWLSTTTDFTLFSNSWGLDILKYFASGILAVLVLCFILTPICSRYFY